MMGLLRRKKEKMPESFLTQEKIDESIAQCKEEAGESEKDQALLKMQIKTLNGLKELIKKRDLLWKMNQRRRG